MAKRWWSRAVVLGVLAAFCSGATAATAATQAKPTGKLTVAVASFGFEATLPTEGSVANHVYWDPMYDYMFYVDDRGNIVPGLIAAWTSSPDGLTWTFSVRRGVKFHHGRELTAEDIAFTFDHTLISKDAKHAAADTLRPVLDAVAVTGPYEVIVKLKRPMPLFLSWLSWMQSLPVVPKEYGTLDVKVAREKPIGTGAFRFVSRSLGENIKFQAVEEHWRRVPAFKELEIRLVPEPSTRLAMLKRGEADIIDIPLSFKPELAGLPFKVILAPQSINTYIIFGGLYTEDAKGYNPHLPWRQREVRQALNLAVDKQAIVEHIFMGEGEPAAHAALLPWQLGWKKAWQPYPYDPDKARQLLAQAGYPDGFEITIMSFPRPGVPDLPAMVEAVADYWSRIGVKAKIVTTEWGAIRPAMRAREANYAVGFSLGVLAEDVWGIAYLRPFSFFEISPELTAAIQQLKAAVTMEELAAAIGEIGDIKLQEYVEVPIAVLNTLYVVNPKTVGEWPVKAHNGGPNHLAYVTHPAAKGR